MSSPAVRRIAVAVGLIVVFGIGVSAIVLAPAQRAAQSPAAQKTPANETFTDQNATNPTAARDAAAAGQTATNPSAAPNGAAAPGAPTADQADQAALTAQVRSSLANVAPDSNIIIKDTNGVVALQGSVPSQNVLEKARQAAQQVSGVKQVDTSALIVANNDRRQPLTPQ
jgi:hypothetical protein